MPGAGQRNKWADARPFCMGERGVDVSMHARMDLCDALPPSRPTPKHIRRKSVPLCHEPFCGGCSSGPWRNGRAPDCRSRSWVFEAPCPHAAPTCPPPLSSQLQAAQKHEAASWPYHQSLTSKTRASHTSWSNNHFRCTEGPRSTLSPSVAAPLQRPGLATMASIPPRQTVIPVN
jgi:hypothetical protein